MLMCLERVHSRGHYLKLESYDCSYCRLLGQT
jgi:hypothetical protein